MKPVSPAPVKALLQTNIGAHGKFTFQLKPGGGYAVAKFDELRSHSKPFIFKSLGGESAFKLKLQLYRAEKSLNLRDSLVAALAKTPFDADVVIRIATKLAKQAPKGGWPTGALNLGAGDTGDASLKSAVKLAHQNLLTLLDPPQGQGKPLSLEVRGMLLQLKNGLVPPPDSPPITAHTRPQEKSDPGNSSMVTPSGSPRTTATARAEEKSDPVPKDRLGQLRRDEKLWINVQHRLFNGDPALVGGSGRGHQMDAHRWLGRVSSEIETLRVHPRNGSAQVQKPLPQWGVNDLALVADTIRVMKKRFAVEKLDLLTKVPDKDAVMFDPAMLGVRLSGLIKSYEEIHAKLQQLAAGGSGNSSRTTQVPAGGGAQHELGGMENALKQLKSSLEQAATTVRQYETGRGGITAEQCSAADMTMDLLLEEIDQIEQHEAQSRLETHDVRTTTTTAGASTTTATSTNTTTSTATAAATPSGAGVTTIVPGGGNSSLGS